MIPIIQNSFISGELSPSFLGRTDKPQYRNGASTMRNAFVRYQGGAYSRAGNAYVGMCKQGAPNNGSSGSLNDAPRIINFQLSINKGFALEFGDQYMRVISNGGYVLEAPPNGVGNILSVTNANPAVFHIIAHGWSTGDWVFITGVTDQNNPALTIGQIDSLTWIVQKIDADNFSVTDLFGNVLDTTNTTPIATLTGTAARIYTAVSPYAAADLDYLKFTENANTMNLVCVNQSTLTEYPPYNLQRITDTNWTFTKVSFLTAITPPVSTAAAATNSTTKSTWYSYTVTSIDSKGNESVASTAADVQNNDIAINAGSNTITWSAVAGATQYNIRGATPIYNTGGDPGFIGIPYGLIGSAFGLQFVDTNILPDFTQTAPIHNNPFAQGPIISLTVSSPGSGLTQSGVILTGHSAAGTNFNIIPILQGGGLESFIINDAGYDFQTGDTITASQSAASTGTYVVTAGPSTGTYPGSVQYFQQRLVYANTTNQPDTYFMSQPGLFTNFDSSIPTVDSNAIIGTPWAVQINGIQWMLPTIQGLITFTGNGVWMVNGGNATAITPSDENAQANSQIGCSATVPPLYVNLHILYVQAKNSSVRDIAFNFLYNVFTGTDITVYSNHLFFGYTIKQWAYAEEPFKLIWAIRNDGTMLSLTYIKEQEIMGWSRHDTNGLYTSICTVVEPPENENVSFAIEPPIDAVYTLVKRYIPGTTSLPAGKWVYYSERQNNRIWQNIEDCFCVDAGLFYPFRNPQATLTAPSANGTNNISDTIQISRGQNYTNPTAVAVDSTGSGTGAQFNLTVVGGVITAITPKIQGQNYTIGHTAIIITDSTGSGAVFQPLITNYVTFTTDVDVSSDINIGDIIRVDGGKAEVIDFVGDDFHIQVNITQPLTQTVPNDPNNLPIPAIAGTWSVSTPITTVTGLNHLEGMTVTGLADGGVIPPMVVTNGQITLQQAASAINVGLGFTAQVQTMYLDAQESVTMQGRRKDILAITPRLDASRGVQVGTNQPDASVQPNNVTVPWLNMKEIKERNNLITAGSAIPLFTGDPDPIMVPGDWNTKGQLAVQQIYPLPLGLMSVIGWGVVGDNPG